MSLSPGSKLGPYEILSQLGAGGMGEVYRARDPRLARDVAIKVLPTDRMADEDRRRRFLREARAASALNHPNIVTIHEIDSVDGIDFIVMEYVAGETLDFLVPREGMRLDQVLRVAIPMADALARAHAAGIVHRDLKPANVMVSDGGLVKVLDFGLAKLVAPKEASMEDVTETDDWVQGPPGTLGYMSPEQADGEQVDARSDVFSFGALLYKMVTGRRAFAGSSRAEILAALMKDQPKPPSEMVSGLPKELDRLILRCLQKDPDRRFQHMGDVRVELQEIKEESASQPAAVPARRNRLWWLAAGLVSALVVTAAAWLLRRGPDLQPPTPRLVPLTSLRGWELNPTFSPDGSQIAFAWDGERGGNADIYLKMIGSSEMRRLTADPAEDAAPSWSPDGGQIAFLRLRSGDPASLWRFPDIPGTIHVVSPVGGSDRRLTDFRARYSQLSWSPDGRWLATARFASPMETDPRASGIYLIPVLGGKPVSITSPKAPTFHTDPALSHDGRRLAYASCFNFLSCQVQVVELGLDYMPTGPARRLTRRAGWIRGIAWAHDGNSLIYSDLTTVRLWRAFLMGDRAPEKIELAGMGLIQPAGVASLNRLAFVQDRGSIDIYRFAEGHAPEPLLMSSASDYSPSLSPDGRRIAFESGRAGYGQEIWLAAGDGSNPTQLTRGTGIWQGSPRWSPDGRRLAFDSQGEDGHWNIWTIDADGGLPSRLTLDPGDEQMASWSRDGRWIYFSSNRGGAPPDIWRIPATGGSEERVTHGGAGLAYESADGKTLYYMRGFANAPLLALPLAGGPERRVLDCVPGHGFAVGPRGVYHFACEVGPSGTPLYVLDPATGRDRLLGNLEKADAGLAVSTDGKTILYPKGIGEGADLMMIENFQ